MVFLCLLPHLPLVTTFPVQYFWSYRRLDFSRYYHRPRVLLRSHFAFVRLRLQIFSRSTSVPISATINTGLSAFITGYKFSRAYVFLFPYDPNSLSYLLLLPVSAGLEYNSALFPVDCNLPANSSWREAAIAFILLFHIDSREVAAPVFKNGQSIDHYILFIKLSTNQQITDCPWVSQ